MDNTRLANLHNAARKLSDAALISFHRPSDDEITLDAAVIVLKRAVADFEEASTP